MVRAFAAFFTLRLERGRELWARLAREHLLAFGLYFVVLLLFGAVAIVWVERGHNPAFQTLEDGLWWAIVSLTTVGYGDKVPATTAGHLIGALVVMLGIGAVGILTAKIASMLVEQRIKEGRGLSDAATLSGHLVILGWKSDMHLLIEQVLAANPKLGAGHVVLVNAAGETANDALRQQFPGLVYIHGDVVDPLALRRANLARAVKVLVLADETGGRSDEEIDARTVMATLTVESLAPEVYTCAEALDRKYAEHLRLARCDEVILSREYSRFLLAGATVAAGVSNVVEELVDLSNRHGLATVPVPSDLVGRGFGELQAHFKRGGRLAIGLLENSGQAHEIRLQALREAQKTADVSRLVENLKRVKQLVPNRPVLNPPDDHPVPDNSLAIVVGRTGDEARP
jgi:voltage-gated potassium channel